MIVDCYFIAWNESETIHLTIKHYQSFCRKVIIYDNFSTDNTREIAESMGCEVRLFGVEGSLDDREYLKVKNHVWKGSDADWVIVCDADEILYHHDLMGMLLRSRAFGNTIFKTNGINIFSNELPKESWLEIRTGVYDQNYSKSIIFNPQKIIDINYQYGCHEFNGAPTGEVIWSFDYPYVLHYKHIGGAERLANRHALYSTRRSPLNKRWHMGDQYDEPRETTIKYFEDNLKQAKILI